jgi:hypothetical protein
MSSKATQYRKTHPEYYQAELQRNRIRLNAYYANNEERREKVKKIALERYYRLKAEKQNILNTDTNTNTNTYIQVI